MKRLICSDSQVKFTPPSGHQHRERLLINGSLSITANVDNWENIRADFPSRLRVEHLRRL